MITLFVQLAIISFILGLFIYRRFTNKINWLNWFIFIFLFVLLRSVTEIITKLLIEQDVDTYTKYGEIHFVVEKSSYVLKNAMKQYLREVKHEFP